MTASLPHPTRRHFIRGGAAFAALMVGGCARANQPARAASRAMTVYRDPGCGCCLNWAALAGQAGFRTTTIDDRDMAAVKRRHGVPPRLASCHTAVVDGYVIEGHVPLDSVNRLLEVRPAGVKGLAVPGMPIGSPGMEAPDGTREPFQVLAFDAAGRAAIFE